MARNNLNNSLAYLDQLAEILETDDVLARFMNDYLAQLLSNDARLKASLDSLGVQTARNAVISGPLTAKGVARIFRDRYGENVCYGGTTISGGDLSGYGKDNAFDGSADTAWKSSQTAAGVNGVACIGYQFATARTIRKIVLNQWADYTGAVSSVKIQRSTDGNTWADVQTWAVYVGKNIIELAAAQAATYWRLLANSNTTGGVLSWGITEVEMYELLNAGLTNADVVVLADAVMTFAAGMSMDTGAIDYRYRLASDKTLTLTAADQNTIPTAYSTNICRGGTAISSGDASGQPASYAFDGVITSPNYWRTSQAYNAIANVGYIGYDFGAAVTKAIRQVSILQATTEYSTQVKVQYSDNGSAWIDASQPTVITTGTNLVTVPAVGAHRYWRILTTVNASNSAIGWVVTEMEMYEAIQTHYIYTDYDPASKTATLGSTKVKPKRVKSTSQPAAGFVRGYYSADLCNAGAGTPISGGDFDGSHVKAHAFDNTTNYWASSQTGSTVANSAWIGYDFGSGNAKRIRRVSIAQQSQRIIASAKVQYSDDAAMWTDWAVMASFQVTNILDGPDAGAHRYWRVFATANQNGNEVWPWGVDEFEMYEYIQPSGVGAGSTTIQQTQYSSDLCNGGTAISGGDGSGTPASNAFNNDSGTGWIASQTTGNQANAAFIGYNFGASNKKEIRLITLNQNTAGTMSTKVQYSDDGSTWSDAYTFSSVTGMNTVYVPTMGVHQYWRLLAQTNLTSGWNWGYLEIEMFTLDIVNVTVGGDDPIYSDNIAVGGAAISSGDYSAQYKELAFDGNTSYNNSWSSSQTGAAVLNTAYIGYDFGVARHIRKMTILWSTAANQVPTSAKIQNSTDGTTWNDVKTITPTVGISTAELLSASQSARYWRIIATAGLAAGYSFTITEITLHEIGTDVNLYDPYKGAATHYDGSTWETKIRLFLGEVNVDTAGRIVGSTTYPYNIAKVKALPAEDSDEAVTLGQFNCFLSNPGFIEIPLPGQKYPLLIQWGTTTAGVQTQVMAPYYKAFKLWAAYPYLTGIHAAATGQAQCSTYPYGNGLTGFLYNNHGTDGAMMSEWLVIGQ